jgi:hypothetical protein
MLHCIQMRGLCIHVQRCVALACIAAIRRQQARSAHERTAQMMKTAIVKMTIAMMTRMQQAAAVMMTQQQTAVTNQTNRCLVSLQFGSLALH